MVALEDVGDGSTHLGVLVRSIEPGSMVEIGTARQAHFVEHVAIVDAVRNRDALKAAALMHEHLTHIQANMFGKSGAGRNYVARPLSTTVEVTPRGGGG
ncbi:hypothetical protein D9M68_981560 [compost metagenome]